MDAYTPEPSWLWTVSLPHAAKLVELAQQPSAGSPYGLLVTADRTGDRLSVARHGRALAI